MLDTNILQLERRLARDPSGPLLEISRVAAAPLHRLLLSAAQTLMRATEDRPLVALLLAFETGFALARIGGRHAHH